MLLKGVSSQVTNYSDRFQPLGELHNSLLVNFIKIDYRKMEVVFTVSQFFGLRRVPFAAVDGTKYTNRMFDLVFFGGSYAAKGTIDFSRDPPRTRS